ncbi:BTAD domain-containing putative transcriptional regulator [soil metagenome]
MEEGSYLHPTSNLDGTVTAVIYARLLGTFQVSIDGQPIPDRAWRQRRAAAIVKLLALEPSHRLHRERLIDLLWPDLSYNAGLNNLRQALYHARQPFQAAGISSGSILQRDGDSIILADRDLVWVDVHAFQQAVILARQAPSPESIRSALTLYGGDLLTDDLYATWAESHRTALRSSYLELLTRLGNLYVESGEPFQAIDAFQRLIQEEPAWEQAHRALMRLYAETGQPKLALVQYDQLAAVLASELDTESEPTTRELAESIATGEVPAIDIQRFSARTARSSAALPRPISSIVGRARELSDIERLLDSGRLVTLTGPGGIGKTRLAIEFAQRMTGVSEAVAFVDLAPLSSPDLVLPAVAEALDVREGGEQSLLTTLSTALCDRNLLLVLDNFEHVHEAGRDIASLLEQAPALRILVTSRVRLRLRGELEYPVPPLATIDGAPPGMATDATTLFIERSRAVRPDLQPTATDRETIDRICQRLAGLPLAIELAAARSRLLSPQAILERLERPLAFLTAGPVDLPARQQTIRETIKWSVDLLDPEQQSFFMRLSVFAGGWTLDAAEMVATREGDPSSALDHLEALADSNLITRQTTPPGEIRFGMLETIRQFGIERLAANGEEAAVRDRHAAWITQFIDQAEQFVEGAEQVTWLARLEREDDNIRTALAWLRERGEAKPALRMIPALRLHWFGRGRISEGLEQIEAVINLPESAAYPALQADALTVVSFLAREAGDYQRAYDATRATLTISHRIHDRKRAADALVNLGFIALQQGQVEDARELVQRSLTAHRELGNEQGIADTLGFLALTDLQQGNLDAAGRRLEQSIAIWSGLDDFQGIAWARAHLGLVRLEQAAYRAAWNELMASLAFAETLNFRGDVHIVFDGLARLAASHAEGKLAARLSATAASIREQSGIRLSAADQERTARFLDDLQSLVDSATIEKAWSERHDWTFAGTISLAREQLAPLLPEA